MRIVITGGGTSGHVVPALQVADALKRKDPTVELLWIGSFHGKERELVNARGISFRAIPTGKLRRYFSLQNFTDALNVPKGILAAGRILKQFKPQVVFSKGGSVSFPASVAAWMQNIPLVTHESDIVPGLANERLAWFATHIALTFPDTKHRFPAEKTVVTGIPIRQDIFNGSKDRARATFGLTDEKPVLLIIPGSQGSVRINEAVAEILPQLLEKFQVIHVVGEASYAEYLERYKDIIAHQVYRVFGYIGSDLPDAYAIADVVLARGGSSMFELAALGKRNLLVPLAESANNHQHENATYFHDLGISNVLLEKNLEPHLLYRNLVELMYNVDPAKVTEAARSVIFPNAASDIANMILGLVYYGKNKIRQ